MANELSQFSQYDIVHLLQQPCTQLHLHTEGLAVNFGVLISRHC